MTKSEFSASGFAQARSMTADARHDPPVMGAFGPSPLPAAGRARPSLAHAFRPAPRVALRACGVPS
jgi:hypothetical protein